MCSRLHYFSKPGSASFGTQAKMSRILILLFTMILMATSADPVCQSLPKLTPHPMTDEEAIMFLIDTMLSSFTCKNNLNQYGGRLLRCPKGSILVNRICITKSELSVSDREGK